MKTYYKITLEKNFDGIETVQVESETPCTITINGDRINKISTYNCYYSDLNTAKRELQDHFSREAGQAETNIQAYKKLLQRFKKYMLDVKNYQI